MGNDKSVKIGSRYEGPDQIIKELKILKSKVEELQQLKNLKIIVAKHNDILQTQDNWHSRVSKWVGKSIRIKTNHGPTDVIDVGILLWTDRYNIGVAIPKEGERTTYTDRVYNKGNITWLEPAEN